MSDPIDSGWSNIAGWVSHPLENAAFARRTPNSDVRIDENSDLKAIIC